MGKPVANVKNKRYVFTIYAKPEEGYDISMDIDLTIIAHTKLEAIDEAKKVLGDEYTYYKVRDAVSLEIYKLKEC
jgi:hypothetical protein